MQFLLLTATFINICVTYACNNGEYPVGNGMISSPNYPNFYDNAASCMYSLHANEGITNGVIKLTFESFDTEACCDRLLIFDGPSILSNQIQQLNGTYDKQLSFLSTQPKMTLMFATDSGIVRSGFRATYTTVSYEHVACPNSLYPADNGSISSPNYPNSYHNNQDCTYLLFTDKPGRRLQITFDTFQTEADHDSLIIYDGPSSTEKLISKLSGRPMTPVKYISTGQTLFLRFKTDASTTNKGFHAKYSLLSAPRTTSNAADEDLLFV